MIELDVISPGEAAQDGLPKVWRSAADRAGTPAHRALQAAEFAPSALDEADEPARRSFMKVMGASMALAGIGLSGCRRPVEKVLPYARKPEDVIPGIPNYYATAMPLGGFVHPLLVETHEGRPTKVEGNPEHPVSRGAANVFHQASILGLYDPDRSRVIRTRRAADAEPGTASRGDFLLFAQRLREDAANRRMVVLAEPTSSPTALRLRDQLLQAYPNARWVTYRAGGDNADAGMQMAGAPGTRPLYRFSRAQTIVSFDADFLGHEDPANVWNMREFAESRRLSGPESTMSRLYAAESTYTITGGQADHRVAMKAGEVPFFAAAVAGALGMGGGSSRFDNDPHVRAIAEDARAGNTVFVAGATQPAEVHALCAALNGRFGGDAVQMLGTGAPAEPQRQDEALGEVLREMNAGQVDTLVLIGVNPGYDAPGAFGWAEAMARVPNTIHLGLHVDETAAGAMWHLPRQHYLEMWGDGRALDGTLSVIQPMIAPLYEDAHSDIELLHVLATGESVTGYDLVRETMRSQGVISGLFEDGWRQVLHDGFVPDSGFSVAGGGGGGALDMSALELPDPDAIELVFRPSPTVGDYATNAWLLELPDPITKVTWDNVAIMSPATADALNIGDFESKHYEGGSTEAGQIMASLVTLTSGETELQLPVWVQPGHPDNSVTVHTGWGRSVTSDRIAPGRNWFQEIGNVFSIAETDLYKMGVISDGVGVNVAPLRASTAGNVLPRVDLEVSGGGYLIATTQDHGSLEGRPIVRFATLDEYRANPAFAQDAVPVLEDTPWEEFPSLWGEADSPQADPRIAEAMYAENQWGMVIDLNACTGCNACVTACQAENNIPVVGKDQVSRGRELHWMRLDRYYVGDEAGPGMVVQPMLCQHCEQAPCESVCPVAATVHSPDGTNQMIYNRCIGTRYCSNNCPYKVRRYNFYNWTANMPLTVQMQQNPDVTVRFRGVMEKCSFCVQRIREANKYAHIEDRTIQDGEVKTACQQSCPAQAITFGDISDPDSEVTQLRLREGGARRYEVLQELAVRPRVSYLARVRNPHPSLAAADPFRARELEPTVPSERIGAADRAS